MPPLATVRSSGQATLGRQWPPDLADRQFDSQQQHVRRVAGVALSIYTPIDAYGTASATFKLSELCMAVCISFHMVV